MKRVVISLLEAKPLDVEYVVGLLSEKEQWKNCDVTVIGDSMGLSNMRRGIHKKEYDSDGNSLWARLKFGRFLSRLKPDAVLLLGEPPKPIGSKYYYACTNLKDNKQACQALMKGAQGIFAASPSIMTALSKEFGATAYEAYRPISYTEEKHLMEVGVAAESSVSTVLTSADDMDDLTALEAFVKVVGENKKARLMVAGHLPAEQKRAAEKFLMSQGMGASISFVDDIHDDRVLELLKLAPIYLSTSLTKQNSTLLKDALHRGCTIICADLPQRRNLLGDSAVFVTVDQGGDIASSFGIAVFGLLENPLLAQQIRNRAKRQSKLFSWDHAAHKVHQVIFA